MAVIEKHIQWEQAAKLLRQWSGRGNGVPTGELADAMLCDDDSIGHYRRNETIPDAASLRLLIVALSRKRPELALELLNGWLLAGTRLGARRTAEFDASELDANGNGKLDGHDSAALGSATMRAIARAIDDEIRHLSDGVLTADELQHELASIRSVEQSLEKWKACVSRQAEGRLRIRAS